MNLLYILSPSYSGSTLLTFMLDQHPEITTIGELKATAMGDIAQYYCSCGELITNCSFWREIKLKCKQNNTPFELDSFGTHFASNNPLWNKIMGAQVRGSFFEMLRSFCLKNIPSLKSEFQGVIDQNEKIVDLLMSNKRPGNWFLDGSKDPNRLKYFLDSSKLPIKVIEMYRDGRAQSHSYCKKYPDEITMASAAKEWVSTVKQMTIVTQNIPAKEVLRIHYEEMCEDPARTMRSIWEFLSLPVIDIDWKEGVSKDTSHILGNNRMRQSNKVSISIDEDWLNAIAQESLREFNLVAGTTNRSLGYK